MDATGIKGVLASSDTDKQSIDRLYPAAAKVKAPETLDAIGSGASEIDMPLNLDALKFKEFGAVKQDIAAIAKGETNKSEY